MSRTYRKESYHKCELRQPRSTNEKRQLSSIITDDEAILLGIDKLNRMKARQGSCGNLPTAYDDIVTSSHYQNDHS